MDTGVIYSYPPLALIIAVSQNGVIGRANQIPWRLSDDLKRFKQLTLGQTVIVGRKTHESIIARLGSTLPGRHTIVVTRQKEYRATDSVQIADSLKSACELARKEKLSLDPKQEIFVIGGAELYRLAYPFTARAYVTLVECELEGDAFFELTFMPPDWQLRHLERHNQDSKNEFAWIWKTFERPKSKS